MNGLYLIGEVVDLDENAWEMGDRKGISYGAFVAFSKRDQPIRVRVTEEQFALIGEGDRVEWPVSVAALANNYGGARLRYTLLTDFAVQSTDATGESAYGSQLASASSF